MYNCTHLNLCMHAECAVFDFKKSLSGVYTLILLEIVKIIPIFKSDDKSDHKNYRPILLLPPFSKIIEKLMLNHILSFIERNNILILIFKQLNKTVQDTGINTSVCGVFKGEQKINNYFKLKNKMPRLLQLNIVYSVKCLNCEAEYIGKTTQHIDARIYQHKIVKDGQHGLTKSHITEHAQRPRHKTDWQNYSVLARASNDYYLKIKETLLIKERMPIMNNNETSVILNLF